MNKNYYGDKPNNWQQAILYTPVLDNEYYGFKPRDFQEFLIMIPLAVMTFTIFMLFVIFEKLVTDWSKK